jgi:hypothetical protein
LTVTGVNAELCRYFKDYVKARGAVGAFYMDQMLADFKQSTAKQPKSAKKSKAAAA